MIEFAGRGILLDIEGTTSSVSFVFDVMFPYVRRELAGFLAARGDEPAVREACEQVARDGGPVSTNAWLQADGADEQRRIVVTEALAQMDRDAKLTGLKALQGLIWESGFASGELKAHVYDDVVPSINAWRAAGKDIRIYSSGSVQAQKLFFGHSIAGDLLPLFSGHYDTRIGSKREPPSYQKIIRDWKFPPGEILFLSDVPAELHAAKATGMRVALCYRPDNATLPADHGLPLITSFEHVKAV